MTVEIKTGKHSTVVAKGTLDILRRKLREAGMPLDSRWVVHAGRAVKGTPHVPEFSVRRISPHKGVEVRVKPGGNDTARTFFIVPPNGMKPEQLFSALREVEQAGGETPQPVPPKPPKPVEEVSEAEESPAPEVPSEERKERIAESFSSRGSLSGFTGDVQNIQLALLALSAGQERTGGEWLSPEEAREALKEEIGLQDASAKGLGAIIGTMERHGYLEGDRTESGHLRGVRLSLKGRRLIQGEMEPRTPSREDRTDPASAEVSDEPPGEVKQVGSIEAAVEQIRADLRACISEEEGLQNELLAVRERRGNLEKALEVLEPLLV